MNSLKYSPFLIKPNIEELSGIFNTEITKQNVNINAEKLISLGAQNALISMGGDGAYLSCSDGKGFICLQYRAQPSTPWAPAIQCSQAFLLDVKKPRIPAMLCA